jgi:hypothetical protein
MGFAWLLIQRYRIETMREELDEQLLAASLAERRSEASSELSSSGARTTEPLPAARVHAPAPRTGDLQESQVAAE